MSGTVIQNLKFDENGLIPAIVQDHSTEQVLTVAYMNAESLARTLQTGETWFWSRSRQELWHKGATSGHTQKVVDIRMDCDGDALLVRVIPNGPACHTGEQTCFFRNTTVETNGAARQSSPVSVVNFAALELGIILQDLYQLIQERKDQRPENSYTTYLFNSGLDKILKKVGEEAAETIIAAKNTGAADGQRQLTSEISDLLYHLIVLMVDRDVSLQDILGELGQRSGKPSHPKYQSGS
ncbi:MAG: bifunctional phosphoribosyl-AMP cyclohydrolase/phosphoribosyl-ATP diphosphatase HisIE [Blastocatellales bacterium]